LLSNTLFDRKKLTLQQNSVS